jgi:N-ethylmaleimide reductase
LVYAAQRNLAARGELFLIFKCPNFHSPRIYFMLFDTFSKRSLNLRNHMVMAPMTRSRATPDHTPDALMATYYGQRATAGLIITEGTSPSPNGLGYPRIPGLYDAAQAEAWKATTSTVHADGGKIFLQLMHCGRVAHVANLPAGAKVLGASTQTCPGEIYTDALGMQPYSTPQAMSDADITTAIQEHVVSAKLAIEAGFDGVELHGANGYLIEQFLNPLINVRTDGYGGCMAARNRMAIETVQAMAQAIGSDRVGIRLSPYGAANGTGEFPDVQSQYLALARSLSTVGLLYIHLVDHSSMGAPPVPADFKLKLRSAFDGLFIVSGGFDHASAEHALLEGFGDLVAFGRPFLANPDLVARMRKDAPQNAPDQATFYVPGPKGYTDYPTLSS